MRQAEIGRDLQIALNILTSLLQKLSLQPLHDGVVAELEEFLA